MRRIVLLLLLSVSAGYGEPDSVVQYLMNEPVSMLDWGLFRLEQNVKKELEEAFKEDADVEVYAYTSYDWTTNRIEIHPQIRLLSLQSQKEPEEQHREYCKELVLKVRRALGVSAKGKPLDVLLQDVSLESLFSHKGYVRNEPKNLKEGLYAITEIKAEVFDVLHGSARRTVCGAALTHAPIYFIERD